MTELECFCVWPSNAEAGQSGTIAPYWFTPDDIAGYEGKCAIKVKLN